jgi:hypothetical protein
MPRLIPRPSDYCRCPVKTGCTSLCVPVEFLQWLLSLVGLGQIGHTLPQQNQPRRVSLLLPFLPEFHKHGAAVVLLLLQANEGVGGFKGAAKDRLWIVRGRRRGKALLKGHAQGKGPVQ